MANVGVDEQKLQVIDCDEDHAKAVAFNMLFMVWRHRTTLVAFRRGIHLAQDLGRSYAEGVGICQLISNEALPPDTRARAAFVDFYRLTSIKHFSIIYEGSGFKAASVRAVISGGQLMGRPQFPHQVHGTIAAAARWHERMQGALGRAETAEQIERHVRELRRRQQERYP